MGASLNRCEFIGNLGRDPEMRYAQSGNAICNFSIATTEQWNGKDGSRQEKTEWINVVAWGGLAENCGKYLAKGRQVYVEGKLSTRKYDDKNGETKYITEVVAREVKFLGGNDSGGRSRGGDEYDQRPSGKQGGGSTFDDSDIPF